MVSGGIAKGDVLEYGDEYLIGQFAMEIFIIQDKRKQKKAHIGLMKMNLLRFKIYKTHSPRL